MDKFIRQAEEEGITSKAIQDMVERDLQYKNDIYEKLAGIKIRQIITIVLGSLVLIIMSIILFHVVRTTQHLDLLVKAIIYALRMIEPTTTQ